MKLSFRYVLIVVAIAIIVALVNIRLEKAISSDAIELRTVELAGQTVHVAVVDTPIARQRGLSGRQGLAGDEGMLFVFPQDGKYSIWMKDMLFSIDIVWIAADGGIVDMVQNVSPHISDCIRSECSRALHFGAPRGLHEGSQRPRRRYCATLTTKTGLIYVHPSAGVGFFACLPTGRSYQQLAMVKMSVQREYNKRPIKK